MDQARQASVYSVVNHDALIESKQQDSKSKGKRLQQGKRIGE
jgi:hypothetical protein